MDKTILEKVKEAANRAETKYVSFFNNGSIKEDNGIMEDRFKKANDYFQSELLLETMVDGAKLYATSYEFDSLDMHLILGLVYSKKEFDKKNAEPIKGIIRYYTGDFDALKDGEKQNPEGRYFPSCQGFVNYDKLMKTIKKSGLDYTGPETFEEFEEQILFGEPFDIKVSANLNKKEEKTTSKIKIKSR